MSFSAEPLSPTASDVEVLSAASEGSVHWSPGFASKVQALLLDLDTSANAWLKAEQPRKSLDPQLRDLSHMDYAIACGRLDVVQSLYRQGFRADTGGLTLAVRHGHRDLVVWLQEIPREVAGDGDTVRAAVEGGGGTALLEAVRGCVAAADTGALDAAVARGDREAMEWLVAAGLKGSSASFCWAIENRDVELLAWLQEQGSRGEAGALYEAAVRGGDLAVIRRLAELGYRAQDMPVAARQELVWVAVERDLVAVVAWLEGEGVQGMKSQPRYMARAVANGSAEMVEYLCRHGYVGAVAELLKEVLEAEVDERILKVLLQHFAEGVTAETWVPVDDPFELRKGDVICRKGEEADGTRHVQCTGPPTCHHCGFFLSHYVDVCPRCGYAMCTINSGQKDQICLLNGPFLTRKRTSSLGPNAIEHVLALGRTATAADSAALARKFGILLPHVTAAAVTRAAWEELLVPHAGPPEFFTALQRYRGAGGGTVTDLIRNAPAVDAQLSHKHGLRTLA